jgi:magnesium transporter
MFIKSIQPEVQELISSRQFAEVKSILTDWDSIELADLIQSIEDKDRALAFRLLPKDLAAETFEYLEFDVQESLLKALGQEEVSNILNEMSPDDRTTLFEELPSSAVKQLIELLSPEERLVAQQLLGYPEDSVGRLMTPDYMAIKHNWTVQEALNYIRTNGQNTETLNAIYITDDQNRLIADLDIRDLLLAPIDKKINEIMDDSCINLLVSDNQEEALLVFKKYDRVTLPVVDSRNYMLGIVTIDDMVDIIEEEATEDIHLFGGMEALEDSYVSTPLFEMIKKRAGWLIILFLGEMLTATAMAYFDDQLKKTTILAYFVPLIISSGGNSGSQAATLIIRSLSLGEVSLLDWWKIMRREIISGLLLGGILGVIGFFRIAAWSMFSNIYGDHWVLVGLTVGFSLVGVVIFGTLAGSMLPFVLKRFGLDPAVSSAPFVATLVDVTGLIIYFTMATLILTGTIL